MVNRSNLRALRRRTEDKGEQALVYWYCTEDLGRFVNLRNVRLLVVHGDVIRVMPGTVIRNETDDQVLLFAATGLCRIRNGRRRGMIIVPSRLRIGENADETGLVKNLRKGGKSNSLHMSDDRDRVLVDRLCRAYDDAIDLTSIIPPVAYIRAKSPDDLSVRLSGEVTKQLMDLDDYDKGLPMEDNFRNLVWQFGVSAGDSVHVFYPFDMVKGNGLVVVDKENMPPPLLVPFLALTAEHRTIRIQV